MMNLEKIHFGIIRGGFGYRSEDLRVSLGM